MMYRGGTANLDYMTYTVALDIVNNNTVTQVSRRRLVKPSIIKRSGRNKWRVEVSTAGSIQDGSLVPKTSV